MIAESSRARCRRAVASAGFPGALVYFDSFKVVRVRASRRRDRGGQLAAGGSYWLNAFTLDHLDGQLPRLSRGTCRPGSRNRSRPADRLPHPHAPGRAAGRRRDRRVRDRHRLCAGREPVLPRDSAGGADPVVQVIRGFGTAIMHGGATAIFALCRSRWPSDARTVGSASSCPAWSRRSPCTRHSTTCCCARSSRR